MTESNTLATTKQAATQVVHNLYRPEGMTRATWTGVHSLLEAIADCYPKAYPSQIRLAARMGVPERTVQRWTAAAVKAGLLVVTPDQGSAPKRNHGSRTNRYYIVIPESYAATMACKESHYSYGVVPGTSSPEPSALGTRLARPAASQRFSPPFGRTGTVTSMADFRERGAERERQVGAPPGVDAEAPVRPTTAPARPTAAAIAKKHDGGHREPPRKRPPKPPPQWKRLAQYFARLWEQMQQETGQYKDRRGLDSYGQAKTYLEAHFANKTELEVRKMMEAFVTALSQGHIVLKPGQSGWRCFTGYWGRNEVPVEEDIYADMRRRLATGKGG